MALDYAHCAGAVAAALQEWYNPRTGLWNRGRWATNWWNSANNLTALIRYMALTGSREYGEVISITYDRNSRHDFANTFYDDTAWWGLAWLAAFDLTAEDRYLQTGGRIFAYLVGAWSARCGGGVQWKTNDGYKNAITNELFLLLAVRLFRRTLAGSYLDWAWRAWTWFEASGMINADHLVNDGLDDDCRPNGRPTYTYNQGVILAGLADLAQVTGDTSLLGPAHAIADTTIRYLVYPGGVLRDPCEPRCGADGPHFKGIFMRHLADLHAVAPSESYRAFIIHNAASLWHYARNGRNQIGLRWPGPFDQPGAAQQGAALDALNAALQVHPSPGAAPPAGR